MTVITTDWSTPREKPIKSHVEACSEAIPIPYRLT